jgi:hypothetical protein
LPQGCNKLETSIHICFCNRDAVDPKLLGAYSRAMTNTDVATAKNMRSIATTISRRAAYERAARKLKKDGRAFINTASPHSRLAEEFHFPYGCVIWGYDGRVMNAARLEEFVAAMGVMRQFERIASRNEEIAAGKATRY